MVMIENLAGRPVSLRLNSGTTLHLPPRTITPEIDDVEVQNNAEVQKLQDRHVIALLEPSATEVGKKSAAAAERSPEKPARKKNN